MERETSIQQELVYKFAFLAEKVRVARERRLFADVSVEHFMEVVRYAYDKLGFTMFCAVTGQDEGESLTFMYHLARKDGIVLNLKEVAPKASPVIPSVSSIYPAAIVPERELVDLFGAKVQGLPPGNRYPLPDNWPEGQYPLRKDWKTSMLGQGPIPAKGE